MTLPQAYRVPAGYGEALLIEKKSRFTGRVWLAETEEEALAHIRETRTLYRDATHNVFAYIIRDGQTRYSDDGEPQGTSGLPALNVFQSEGVYNVCCVVTRYYGGILLGAGGLVRAYSKTAKMALDAAGIAVMRQWDVVLIPCPYALFERVQSLTAAHGGIIESSEFGAEVMVETLLPSENAEQFVIAVRNASAGRVEAERVDTVFRGGKAEGSIA